MEEAYKAERKRRIAILRELGMQEREADNSSEAAVLCSIMFRLEEVYADVVMELTANERFREIKMDFEKNYDAAAYYGIYSEERDGKQLALLYISKCDTLLWEEEREMLKAGKAMAYVYNLIEGYDDVVQIGIKVRNGVVIRV